MKIVALLSALALCSCSYTTLQRGDAKAVNVRWFWVTEGFTFADTNSGVVITLQKSNPDAEAMKAIAEGAAKGAVQGVK